MGLQQCKLELLEASPVHKVFASICKQYLYELNFCGIKIESAVVQIKMEGFHRLQDMNCMLFRARRKRRPFETSNVQIGTLQTPFQKQLEALTA